MEKASLNEKNNKARESLSSIVQTQPKVYGYCNETRVDALFQKPVTMSVKDESEFGATSWFNIDNKVHGRDYHYHWVEYVERANLQDTYSLNWFRSMHCCASFDISDAAPSHCGGFVDAIMATTLLDSRLERELPPFRSFQHTSACTQVQSRTQ